MHESSTRVLCVRWGSYKSLTTLHTIKYQFNLMAEKAKKKKVLDGDVWATQGTGEEGAERIIIKKKIIKSEAE